MTVTAAPLVVVLDRSDALVRGLSKAIAALDGEPEVHLFERPAEVEQILGDADVDVLVVGPSEMTAAGLRRVARWHAAYPSMVVVVASERSALPDPVLLMKAGAHALLKLPAGPASIRTALASALEAAAARHRLVPGPPVAAEPAEASGPPVVEEPEPAAPAVTITVASATGGCGKTFLATNLAYLLAKGTGKRVAMIDLDLQFGEVVSTLQLKPVRTIADLDVGADGVVDVRSAMTVHAGGFDVLAAPPDPVIADSLRPQTISAAIDALRAAYDYVIVDTPPTLNEVVLGSFDVSDHLIVLATLDVPSVRNMRVFLSTLDRLRIPTDGLHLVLNKAERNVGMTSRDIEKILGRQWDLELPYDREVSRSVNLGLPVSESAPYCEVSRRLIEGVPELVPGIALTSLAPPPRPSLIKRALAAMFPSRPSALVEEKMP